MGVPGRGGGPHAWENVDAAACGSYHSMEDTALGRNVHLPLQAAMVALHATTVVPPCILTIPATAGLGGPCDCDP